MGSSFIPDVICKFWILFVNSEYLSVCRAGQRKYWHLFFGKNPSKERSVGFGASKTSIPMYLSSSGSDLDEILVDFHGFELPSGVPTSLHAQTLENQGLFQFSLGHNSCRIRGKFHPRNPQDSLKILEMRLLFPIQKILSPQSVGRGQGRICPKLLDHLSLNP